MAAERGWLALCCERMAAVRGWLIGWLASLRGWLLCVTG
jgi:hypothetical protein